MFVFHFLLLLQLATYARARPRETFDELDALDEILTQASNDANLSPGFDINAYRQNQLDLHNYYRSLHGAPLMTKNDTLTAQAQSYAEELATRNALRHCADTPGCNPYDAGENLASGGNIELNATVLWYNEIHDYNFCYDMDTSPTKPGSQDRQIGHFTQVVWEGSTELGIGYARTADGRTVYVVARYKPAGNVRSPTRTLYRDNVKFPNYLNATIDNNCQRTNGNFTDWMADPKCSRSCGGGVLLDIRTCTNPKPSLNGALCVGNTKRLRSTQWCNNFKCLANEDTRGFQCSARFYRSGRAYTFPDQECVLFCFLADPRFVEKAGNVDDGTHCSNGSCVNGVCMVMDQYVEGTRPPSTTAEQTTTEATTAEPTTTEATTTEATTTEATTTEATTAEPTTAEPTTTEAITAEPTTAEPTTAEPTTAEPTTAEPTTTEATTETTTAEAQTKPKSKPTTAEPTTSRTNNEGTKKSRTNNKEQNKKQKQQIAIEANNTTEQQQKNKATAEKTAEQQQNRRTTAGTTTEAITAEPTTAEPTTTEPTTAEPTTTEATTAEATTAEATTAEATTAEPTTTEATTTEATTVEATTTEATTAEQTTTEATTAEPTTIEATTTEETTTTEATTTEETTTTEGTTTTPQLLISLGGTLRATLRYRRGRRLLTMRSGVRLFYLFIRRPEQLRGLLLVYRTRAIGSSRKMKWKYIVLRRRLYRFIVRIPTGRRLETGIYNLYCRKRCIRRRGRRRCRCRPVRINMIWLVM
ncbi:uncharacterized protein LOC124433373 [Xenia sp. Carnegie-2017]|uniref:uncharacterized protein LOC124433373 n=1 Tax=Xenia sp. Carnegie-2017 TaxID=2897299 RepID=UPI001F04ECBF|nr:uncharacterized protein LOC124433373 [Xenia sp. Carnegie-2017]